MSVPTRQMLNLLSKGAKVAADASQTLAELQMFLAAVAVSPSAAGITAADFSTRDSGTFKDFDPARWTAFIETAQGVVKALGGNDSTRIAFAAMAEMMG